MEAYKNWVRTNKEYVLSMESLANGLTWFLPERFSASEIGPEAVTTVLGMLTAINEHIIDTTPTQMRAGPSEPLLKWSLCISMLKDLETLVEVVAQQFYGDEKKWNFIALIEAVKAVVRLAMLRDSGYKMLLQGGEVVNVEKRAFDSGNGNFAMPNPFHGPGPSQGYHGPDPRTPEGRAMLALNRFGMNAKMASDAAWLNRFQSHQALVTEKPSISTILSEKGLFGGLFVSAEVLFILRPLLYTLFIRRYGLQSWKPWLISLAIDVTGMAVLSRVSNQGNSGRKDCLQFSTSEKDEVKRRKLVWALYLMRDPFFAKYTRDRLESTERILAPVPLLGLFTAKLVELIGGAQTRYTYTSAS